MDKLLDNLSKEIKDFTEHVEELSLIPNVSAQEISSHLKSRYSFSEPMPLEEINFDVQKMMRDWTLHTNHPHYMGLFVPGTMLPSVVADTLVALYNPQLGVWNHAPAACEIERYTLQYLMKKFGMDPDTGSANFTTGGTEANLSAVLTALTKSFPEYGEYGVRSLKHQPVFYVSEEAHHSFIKTGHVVGIGSEAVRNVPADKRFKLDMAALRNMVETDKASGFIPFLVVGTAGTTSAGEIDPLPEIAEFCKAKNLWFHVDAAYGGAAIMSDRLKRALAGIERADSITCDAHKWFSVSMSAGMFFCRNRKYVAETFHAGAAYLPQSAKDTIDAFNTSLQCSRRFIGLKLFMTLAQLGEKGYSDLIDRQSLLGDHLRTKLQAAGFKIVNETPLPVVCFAHPKIDDALSSTADVLNLLYLQKKFWISQTKLKNRIPVLRACITSYRTTEKDLDGLVSSLTEIIEKKVKTGSAIS